MIFFSFFLCLSVSRSTEELDDPLLLPVDNRLEPSTDSGLTLLKDIPRASREVGPNRVALDGVRTFKGKMLHCPTPVPPTPTPVPPTPNPTPTPTPVPTPVPTIPNILAAGSILAIASHVDEVELSGDSVV